MRTIAVVNHKGGVGKTAVSMSLAERLHSMGYKTLLIDLDQQLNATHAAEVKTSGVVTVYDLLVSPDWDVRDGIQQYQHGDIIAGDILVCNAESEMTRLDTPLTMLTDALEEIEDEYDFCIIDCPPSLGYVTRNAMVAADTLIIVVMPDGASIDGFGKCVEVMSKIRENKHLNPGLEISGVLINGYDPRGILDREVDQALVNLAEHAGTRVFDTRIRKCVKVRQAQSKHIALHDFDADCTSAIDFTNFTNEFLAHEKIGEKEE